VKKLALLLRREATATKSKREYKSEPLSDIFKFCISVILRQIICILYIFQLIQSRSRKTLLRWGDTRIKKTKTTVLAGGAPPHSGIA
jgi:hypothetical protein